MFNIKIEDGTFAALHIVEIIVIIAIIGTIVILLKLIPRIMDARIIKQKELNKQYEEESKAVLDNIEITINRFENEFNSDRTERETRQKQIDKRFTEIEQLLGKVSQGALENMLHDETQSKFKRLKAFRRLMAMRVNGRIKQYGILLIINNKETWHDVMDTKLDINIIDNAYYSNVLTEINRRIFETGGAL